MGFSSIYGFQHPQKILGSFSKLKGDNCRVKKPDGICHGGKDAFTHKMVRGSFSLDKDQKKMEIHRADRDKQVPKAGLFC